MVISNRCYSSPLNSINFTRLVKDFYFRIFLKIVEAHMAELSHLTRIREKFGWEDFPFSLDIIPEIFAGKDKILNPIMEQLAFGSIVYIEGNYGSGKSQILKHLYHKMRKDPAYSRFIPILIQEPLDTSVIVHAFKRKFKIESALELIGDLTEELEDIVSSRQSIILLVDEAQELVVQDDDSKAISEEKHKTLQWLRVLSDFRGCKIFMAGLTNFGKKINEMFRPLEDRVTLNFNLQPLDFESTVELIRQRIEFFSPDPATALNPFDQGALKVIYQLSGGYPRAILKLCQDAVLDMLGKSRESISADHVLGMKGVPKNVALSPSSKDVRKMATKELEQEMKSFREKIKYDTSSITPAELDVLKYLATREGLTPQEVADGCGITSGTAANILRKLRDMGYLFRKKQGRTFSYTLYAIFRREFFEG
ncbi:MarR family transcriptional regulator [Candidatus Bathyarchaeota archaeon]|nr:MarR family transcriptional regulator [Candidatus Bathyarchaeota archaeon]